MVKSGKNFEADYFLKENAQAKHELKKQEQREAKKEHEEKIKKLHYNKCPKCGHNLETKRLTYVDIDQCPHCGTVVLAPENVDKFLAEEKSVLKLLVDFFK